MRLRSAVIATVLILQAAGNPACQQMVDGQVLQEVRQYFPRAEIHKCFPDMLHIETRIGNISAKFADETFRTMMAGARGPQIHRGMTMAGYRWLSLGFDDFNVVWTNGGNPIVLNRASAVSWMVATYGRVPAPGSCVYIR